MAVITAGGGSGAGEVAVLRARRASTVGEMANVTIEGRGEATEPDVDQLYRALSKPLERIVRLAIKAPDPLIEDACQFAWARLVHHRSRVGRETALPWLVKTALHEAFKLLRPGRREQSLDAELEDRGELPAPDLRPGPSDLYEQRERLSGLTSLSTRHQRLLWMYGLGLKYEEIAVHDGSTARTVERQLARARKTLRRREGGAIPVRAAGSGTTAARVGPSR